MFREIAQARLERGSASPAARALARVWERFSRVERPLAIPDGVKVIGVGGATLGGSGKTPAVLAIARELAKQRVAVVARAYRARPRIPRRVRPDDPVTLVGDDALYLARELADVDVPVFVAPARGDALRLAAEHAGVVIIDGLLQARPERVALSLLVLDAERPWGSGRCPPAGDLRAKEHELFQAADVVIAVGDGDIPGCGRPVWRARSHVTSFDSMRQKRVGVALAIAHPERVLRQLEALGVRPLAQLLVADHARFDVERLKRLGLEHRLDAWVTTGKCAVKLDRKGLPVWVLGHRLEIEKGALPRALEAW